MQAPLPRQQLKLSESKHVKAFGKGQIYSEVKLYSHVLISLKRNRSVVIRHEMAMDNVTGIFLRKEVEELRKQGESWGLTKDEIDQAILRALGGKVVPISLRSFSR